MNIVMVLWLEGLYSYWWLRDQYPLYQLPTLSVMVETMVLVRVIYPSPNQMEIPYLKRSVVSGYTLL
jgi:hypothetical protein